MADLSYATEPEFQTLLREATDEPGDRTRRLVFADWIQDRGDEEEAQRVRSGAPVRVFSLPTALGTFTIGADWLALLYPSYQPPVRYAIRNDRAPGYEGVSTSPYTLIRHAAEHRLGWSEWDHSGEEISDYAGDWARGATPELRLRLLRVFLALRPEEDMCGVVDHFEQSREGFFARTDFKPLFVELLRTGAITKLPDMKLAPAELRGLTRRRKRRA